MRRTFDLPQQVWSVLKPILEEYEIDPVLMKEDNTPINLREISGLQTGVRLANILMDGDWPCYYSRDHISSDGKPRYSIKTFGDLRRITKYELCRHAGAGEATWKALVGYRKKLGIESEVAEG